MTTTTTAAAISPTSVLTMTEAAEDARREGDHETAQAITDMAIATLARTARRVGALQVGAVESLGAVKINSEGLKRIVREAGAENLIPSRHVSAVISASVLPTFSHYVAAQGSPWSVLDLLGRACNVDATMVADLIADEDGDDGDPLPMTAKRAKALIATVREAHGVVENRGGARAKSVGAADTDDVETDAVTPTKESASQEFARLAARLVTLSADGAVSKSEVLALVNRLATEASGK